MTSNIVLKDHDYSNDSTKVVTIGARQVEEIWTKNVSIIETPGLEDSDLNPMGIDLIRGKKTFTIRGEIGVGGEAVAGDFSGSDTAQEQRTKLRNLMNTEHSFQIIYALNASSITSDDVNNEWVIPTKLSITEISRDETTPTSYTVMIQVVKCRNVYTGEGE